MTALREAAERHRRADGTINFTELGVEIGVHRSNAKKQCARLGLLGFEPVIEGFGISQVSSKSGEAWVKQRPLGEAFVLPEGQAVKGYSVLTDAQDRVIAKWTKTGEIPGSISVLDDLLSELSPVRGKSELVEPPPACLQDLLTVYPIADAHLGLLAWGKETGVPTDLNIAIQTLSTTMAELVQSAPRSALAIVLNLGDFTHANDATAATPTSKHQLDVDGRFPKTARAAIRIARQMVELALAKHEYVIYRGLPGNHDPDVAHLVSLGLEMFFENNPRVMVDVDPSDFFHFQFGNVMLAANHGHKLKADELPGVMAAFWPEIWGKTKKRYGFSAHYHQIKRGEKHGASWEIFRTSAAKDSYSHSHGYSSDRELVAITYHRLRGEHLRTTASI